MEYDKLPTDVRQIIDQFRDGTDAYKECERIISELNNIGWDADYGLDGILYDFKKK